MNYNNIPEELMARMTADALAYLESNVDGVSRTELASAIIDYGRLSGARREGFIQYLIEDCGVREVFGRSHCTGFYKLMGPRLYRQRQVHRSLLPDSSAETLMQIAQNMAIIIEQYNEPTMKDVTVLFKVPEFQALSTRDTSRVLLLLENNYGIQYHCPDYGDRYFTWPGQIEDHRELELTPSQDELFVRFVSLRNTLTATLSELDATLADWGIFREG